MTTIIGFCTQKGGSGKSTLARGLAREAVKAGLSTRLADLDLQQATSLDWSRRRLEAGLTPMVTVMPFKNAEQALSGCDDIELLVIDAPARASEGTLKIAQQADFLVQPCAPSVDDLRPAVLLFHELTRAGISAKKLAFALNHVLTDNEEASARNFIEEAGYRVLQGSLPSKTSYREAQNAGRSVTETRFPALNQRADELLTAIIDCVEV